MSDDILFFDDTPVTSHKPPASPWKVLIADDEEEVHAVTRMVLDGFTFENRKLQLLGTYSGEETRAILQHQTDIAVILLDVVMEEDDSGLAVVKFIREALQNSFVRIILRSAAGTLWLLLDSVCDKMLRVYNLIGERYGFGNCDFQSSNLGNHLVVT